MTGNEELTELLDELDRQTAAAKPDEAVERARESLEETLAGLKLTPEEETALADELRNSVSTFRLPERTLTTNSLVDSNDRIGVGELASSKA